MASMVTLPAELFGLVIAHSEREELKALRLTDHALSNLATAKLFEEIHISPNSSSFDRAHSIAGNDSLNQHVRSLVYHFGKLADVYAGFDSFKYEYYATRETKSAYDLLELNPEVLWNYNCWLEELDAQRTFDLRDEVDELCDLCSRLARLEAISTILDEANVFGDQEDYIGKRTGMAAVEDDGWLRFPRLFAATVDKPLRKISARSIQWHDLDFMGEGSASEVKARHDCLGKLKFLELAIYRATLDQENESGGDGDVRLRRVDLFDTMLGYAERLETLKLDFDELPFESEPHETLPLAKVIFSHHWPRLKELKLEALCIYADEFCDFLYNHRTTLLILCIGDIELVSCENEVPSVLSVFLRLHDFLRLQSCRITGNFTNRVNQGWYVDTEHKQPGCLRDQLEEFLCGKKSQKSKYATNDLEKDDFLQPGTSLTSWLHKVDGEYEAFVDDSWQWAPELLPVQSPEYSPATSPSSETEPS